MTLLGQDVWGIILVKGKSLLVTRSLDPFPTQAHFQSLPDQRISYHLFLIYLLNKFTDLVSKVYLGDLKSLYLKTVEKNYLVQLHVWVQFYRNV